MVFGQGFPLSVESTDEIFKLIAKPSKKLVSPIIAG